MLKAKYSNNKLKMAHENYLIRLKKYFRVSQNVLPAALGCQGGEGCRVPGAVCRVLGACRGPCRAVPCRARVAWGIWHVNACTFLPPLI